MTDAADFVVCPKCQDPRSESVVREERSKKMRWLMPGSRKFTCYRCGVRFIRFLGATIKF